MQKILIYQLEATFDYFITAQSKKLSNEDIALINKWIQQQLDNKLQVLYFKTIDLLTAKLFIFVDRIFANNKDQSFQIDYVITLRNEYSYIDTNEFTIEENLIHWSLTKCRRVTQSVLASWIYVDLTQDLLLSRPRYHM